MKKKYKIGLVGLGNISKKHIEAITLSKYFILEAICDLNTKNLENFKHIKNIKFYNRYKNMLQDNDIDIISICSPSGLHAKQAILASKYKKIVITEKPMATNLKDAKSMINIFSKQKLRLFVIKQLRFNPSLLLMKDIISKNKLGKIYLIQSNIFWNRNQKYYEASKWRGSINMDGGAMLNQSSHFIDLINWFCGPIKKVSSYIDTLARKIKVEDTSVINFITKNLTYGSIAITMLNYEKNFESSLSFVCENGSIKLKGQLLDQIEDINFKDKKLEKNLISKFKSNYKLNKNYHTRFYNNVGYSLSKKESSAVSGFEGYKSLEIIFAAKKSSKLKKTVIIN